MLFDSKKIVSWGDRIESYQKKIYRVCHLGVAKQMTTCAL